MELKVKKNIKHNTQTGRWNWLFLFVPFHLDSTRSVEIECNDFTSGMNGWRGMSCWRLFWRRLFGCHSISGHTLDQTLLIRTKTFKSEPVDGPTPDTTTEQLEPPWERNERTNMKLFTLTLSLSENDTRLSARVPADCAGFAAATWRARQIIGHATEKKDKQTQAMQGCGNQCTKEWKKISKKTVQRLEGIFWILSPISHSRFQ